jgi:Fe-S-cluster containining protein
MDRIIENLNLIPDEYVRELFKFPYNHTNGVCEKLDENGKCSVYDSRPMICNSDTCRDFLNVSQEEFNRTMIPLCNQFMDEDNIDISYRIPL